MRIPTKEECEEVMEQHSAWTDNYNGTNVKGLCFLHQKIDETKSILFLLGRYDGVANV